MKTHNTKTFLAALAFCLLTSAFCLQALAQGTAFTYQGRLTDGGGPANGSYDLRLRLASDAFGNNYVGDSLLTNGVSMTNGLFTVTLDFGGGIFAGSNYWLEVDVRTNGGGSYTTLNPLQALTPTPYAVFAEGANAAGLSGTIPAASFSGSYLNPITLNNAGNNFSGAFSGNGAGLTNVNAATLGGLSANQFWKTAGNSNTVAGVNFLGTADNQAFEVRVNATRALRVEPGGTNGPNVVWGHPANSVAAGVVGAVIAGGGGVSVTSGAAFTNRVTDAHGVVGGGLGNVAGDDDADPSNARYATVGGGVLNTAAAFSATVAGGYQNSVRSGADDAAIGGGTLNSVSAPYDVIGGGQNNTIQTNSPFATISGGGNHSIGTNSNSTTISGGFANNIRDNTFDAVIGGGSFNWVGMNSYYATLAGGRNNAISDDAPSATIAGGFQNFIVNGSSYATIGGGSNNVGHGLYATVPGGSGNIAAGQSSFAAGSFAHANDSGAFVWSDASDFLGFSSTVSNQFSVRATGGVRFVTSGGAGVGGMTLDGQAVLTTGALANVALLAGGNTFSGTQTLRGVPGGQLILQNSSDNNYWFVYDDNSDNLTFQPNTLTGGFISRADGNYHINSDARLK